MKTDTSVIIHERSQIGSLLAGCILSLLVTLIPHAAWAQSTATVTGTVMDQSKAVVPGADVLLVDEKSGDVRRTVSNGEGYFTISAVQAKTYKLRIELTGFQAWERVGIEVHPGDKINISDIVLAAGAQSETVTVSAEANELIPVDSAEKSNLITAKQIQNLSII